MAMGKPTALDSALSDLDANAADVLALLQADVAAGNTLHRHHVRVATLTNVLADLRVALKNAA
jgi:hypothetical protein